MSVDALKEFSKKCVTDETLKKRVKEIGLKDLDGLVAYGKEQGYEFSKEDFGTMAKEAEGNKELSDADLEKVAGGIVSATAMGVAGLAVAVVGTGAAVAQTTSGSGW